MSLLKTLKYITNHPLNKSSNVNAVKIFLKWQIGTKILGLPAVVPFVDDTRLVVKKGMFGATGNVYCGLHEANEMGFLLHYLRKEDVFCDVGANVGTYSILAAGAAGSKTYSIEPGAKALGSLYDNIRLNGLDNITVIEKGAGDTAKEIQFTDGLDTINHVVTDADASAGKVSISVDTLDSMLGGVSVDAMKIDVEGFEVLVLRGAQNLLASENLNAVIMERRGHGARYGLKDTEIDEIMLKAGFNIFTYDPVNRKILAKHPDEITDVIYIKDVEKAEKRVKDAPYFRLSFGRKV